MPNHIFAKEYNKERFIQMADSTSVDAFGRLRVSEPVTLLDYKQIHSNLGLFWDDQETSGSGTSSSHSTATASTTISVSANTAGTRLRRTFQRANYQPGRSHLIMMTAQMVSQTENLTGITGRVGYFDDNDGVFFSLEDGVAYAVIRSSTSGSPVETKVAQSDWNVDRFDGTGPSGITLDPTLCQILWFDLEWLGTGRVRFGFNIGGVNYCVHESDNSNSLSTVYMSTPNLPLSYEISNDGTGAASSLQHICSTVISEGGFNPTGRVTVIDNGTTAVDAATGGTKYALVGIRLNSATLDTVVTILSAEVLMTTAGTFHWEILFNPTISAGTPSWSQISNSALDRFTGDGNITLTGGTHLASGYGASTGSGGSAAGIAGSVIENAIRLGSAIDGTEDIIVLSAAGFANTESFLGGLTVRELS